ncbi:MAG: hypothetical protein IID18_05310, partial [Nitrospinae bacterium]|nr:hypothetical protein [Nitrospinota bacterium]
MATFVVQQIWGIALFVTGGWILSLCSKWEREEAAVRSDPRNRYGRRKNDIMKPKSARGTFMAIVGVVMTMGGMMCF